MTRKMLAMLHGIKRVLHFNFRPGFAIRVFDHCALILCAFACIFLLNISAAYAAAPDHSDNDLLMLIRQHYALCANASYQKAFTAASGIDATSGSINWFDTSSMVTAGTCSAPWNGDQTAVTVSPDGKYHISTAEELAWVMERLTSNIVYKVVLDNDIDLNGSQYYWSPARMVKTGQLLDGQGHTIYNLCPANNISQGRVGFISAADGNARVQNINFHTAIIVTETGDSTNNRAGIIALTGSGSTGADAEAAAYKAHYYNIHGENMLVVGNQQVGTLFGRMQSGSIDNCSTINSVLLGKSHVGSLSSALVGTATRLIPVSHSYTLGCAVISYGSHSGGFISCGAYLDVSDCFTDIHIYGDDLSGAFIGAINGGNQTSKFTNCAVSGFIDGSTKIGGFVGAVEGLPGNYADVSFNNCYSAALVGLQRSNSNIMGGFFGTVLARSRASFTNCYAFGEVGSVDTTMEDINHNDIQAEFCGGFAGVIEKEINATASIAFDNCYYDKQTSAMREWAVGDNRSSNTLSGLKGILTTTTTKCGVGLVDPSFSGMGTSGYDYSEPQHTPELKAFSQASTAGGWVSDQAAATARAFSAASTSTLNLDTWEYGLNTTTGKLDLPMPADTYCTVRDITSGFQLTTSPHITVWERMASDSNTLPEDAKTVIKGLTFDVLNLRYANNQWMADELIPGIEWLRVTVNKGGATVTRRVRVIPTASIDAGESVVIADKYDHADDVRLFFSSGVRMSTNETDITAGIYPDRSDISNPYPLSNANPLTELQIRLAARTPDATESDINGYFVAADSNDAYSNVDVDFMSSESTDNAAGGKLYVFVYEVTGFGPNNEILYDKDAPIPLSDPLGSPTDFATELNGYMTFTNTEKRFLVSYYWVLSDERVLQDAKLLRKVQVPFSIDLNLYNNAIQTSNLYATGGFLYSGVEDDTSRPILSNFSSFTSVAQQQASVSNLADYWKHAQTAWKFKYPADTFIAIKVTLKINAQESYSVEIPNPVAGSPIIIPYTEYRIVYRNERYYTYPETVYRKYILMYDTASDVWYLDFDKVGEMSNGYTLNDVESDIQVDVVVHASAVPISAPPKTGDNFPLMLLLILMGGSFLLLYLLGIKRILK